VSVQKSEKSETRKKKKSFLHLLNNPEMGLVIPLVVLIIIIGTINPSFFNFDNLINIMRNTSFTFIIAIAMTFVLISAGLDLSVGSLIALGGTITGMLLKAGIPIPLSILLGVALGALVGLINGLTIVRFKIPPLIVTLGMLYAARGLVLVFTKGAPVYPLPPLFNEIGQGGIAGIPYVIIIAAILGIVAHIILTKTTYGRAVYATGGNEETARLSGINVDKIKLSVYMLTGMASTFTGMLMAGRLASAQANAGTGWELQVIAAVIIGGTSMFGGAGSILGTLLGAFFMNVVATGMILMRISAYWQDFVIGIIIVLAVGIDQFRRRRSGLN